MTDRELKFALNIVQELQRVNLGKTAMSIMTCFDTCNFAVTINFNFEKLKNSESVCSEYETITFTNETTNDEYVDKMMLIEKLIKKAKK